MYLEEQRRAHGKVLFTVTELANVAAVSRPVLNVELARLRRQGVIEKYAHGVYGLPNVITPAMLVAALDSHAYLTGSYVLYMHNLITQAPTRITCFTDRRSPRACERITSVGHFIFVCVRSRIYAQPAEGVVASPAQALCDFIYVTRRQGKLTKGMVTFRGLTAQAIPELDSIIARYPVTVQRQARALASGAIQLDRTKPPR
ncbi:MAG: hypothetical protein WC381_08080 [Kiritimatiellia bacterium]|jgi:hypothetical protein